MNNKQGTINNGQQTIIKKHETNNTTKQTAITITNNGQHAMINKQHTITDKKQ